MTQNPIPSASSSPDASAIRARLMTVALPYVESLKRRPGLAGIMLYGSMARGDVTPSSDIDLALYYEGDPPRVIERRMTQGEKIDLLSFPMARATKLLDSPPRSVDAEFPFSYALESLLTTGEESILYDPTDELRRVVTTLREKVSFPALLLASLSDGYLHFFSPNRDEAKSLLESGDFAKALEKAKWSGNALAFLLRTNARSKDSRRAAEGSGIPEFADKREELTALLAPPSEAAEAAWTSTQSLWSFSKSAVAEPLRDHLRSLGVADPDSLEFDGDYDLFWPGNSLNEFGRTMGEVNYALLSCRSDLDRGLGAEALRYLWSFRGSQGVRHRWDRLSAALKDIGHDCSLIIEPMLADAEFARLGENLDRAMTAVESGQADRESVEKALALVEEMEAMLARLIPFMTEEELADWKRGAD